MQAARGTPLTGDGSPDGFARDTTTSGARPRLLMAAVALVAYVLDVGTKIWAVEHLTGREPLNVVGDLLRFNLTRNPGAAFSTGTGLTLALSSLAVVAVVVILWVGRRVGTRLWALALGLLLAGVGGNLTDRLFRAPGPMRGHVVDFMQLPHWPIFNVADICIDTGVALIVLQALRGIAIDGRRTGHEEEQDGDLEPEGTP
ncbi:MAG: signal peptidase II [Nocardioidaceae bacterium]